MEVLTHRALAPRGALGEWARRAAARRLGRDVDSLTGHVLLDAHAAQRGHGRGYTSYCTRHVDFERVQAFGIPLATDGDLW